MQLQRIMDSLALGELSQTSYVDPLTLQVAPDKYRNVINSVNLALSSLYTFFDIREKEIFIELMEGKSQYKLTAEHALTNDTGSTQKYIIDTYDNPFIGDILRITQAYTECGEELPLNDDNDCRSIFLPDYDTIQVPIENVTQTISLIYTAKADVIPLDTLDLTLEVDIPDTLLNALIMYVGHRLIGARTDQESQSRGRVLLMDYNTEVARIKDLNLYNSSYVVTDSKLEMRGFV